VSQVSRQAYIETMQPRLFEEWIEKGHQQDANLCSAYARPTDERSLVRGGEGYNQGSLYTLPRREGIWRGSVPDDVWDKPSCSRNHSQCIAKGEMTMRYRGVVGEEVGVKCGCTQGCCEFARLGMRSWWRKMQVAMSTRTNRFGTTARQSQVSPPHAHYD